MKNFLKGGKLNLNIFYIIILYLAVLAPSLAICKDYIISGNLINANDLKKSYLYEFYFDDYRLIDTSDIINGSLGFNLDYNHHPGIYKIRLSPDKTIENIIFNHKNIEFNVDLNDIVNSLTYKNSPENRLLNQYFNFTGRERDREQALYYLLNLYEQGVFYNEIIKELNRLKQFNANYLDSLIEVNRKLLAARYIKYDQLPRFQPDQDGSFKNKIIGEFWNNIDFNDSLLIYLPLLVNKIDNYFALHEERNLTREDHERLFIKASEALMLLSKTNPDLQTAIAKKLLKDSEQHGLYDLYHYLLDNYIEGLNLNEQEINSLLQKKGKLKSMSIGSKVNDFQITRELSLYDIKKPYTLIIFWEPSCFDCDEFLSELKSLYSKNKEDLFEIVAIAITADKNEFKKSVIERGYQWINFCDFKAWNSEIINVFNIMKTPSAILLDRNKKIINRPVSTRQIEEVIFK